MADLDYISEYISSSVGINDSELQELIIDTIARLPESVQEFACERCRYLSIGRNANAVMLGGSLIFPAPLHLPEGIKWAIEQGRIEELLLNPPNLILLSDQMVDEYEPDNVMSVIAHEIAHAFLGHDTSHGELVAAEKEVEACNLTSQWGFSGRGTDSEERAAFFTDLLHQES